MERQNGRPNFLGLRGALNLSSRSGNGVSGQLFIVVGTGGPLIQRMIRIAAASLGKRPFASTGGPSHRKPCSLLVHPDWGLKLASVISQPIHAPPRRLPYQPAG